MNPKHMTPTEAIQNLDDLMRKFNERLHRMHVESDGVQEHWAALGHVGAQRDDHAAELLSRLRQHLSGLATLARTCEQQLDRMQADPFGRNAA